MSLKNKVANRNRWYFFDFPPTFTFNNKEARTRVGILLICNVTWTHDMGVECPGVLKCLRDMHAISMYVVKNQLKKLD